MQKGLPRYKTEEFTTSFFLHKLNMRGSSLYYFREFINPVDIFSYKRSEMRFEVTNFDFSFNHAQLFLRRCIET